MQRQYNQQTNDRDSGFSSDMAETAAGSEILESFFSAAIGVPIPSIGGIDAGHTVDAIDEFHNDKQSDRQFELGQKAAITQEFNFGGTNYNSTDDQELEETWQPQKSRLEHELAMVKSFAAFNPDIQQRASFTPAF